MQPWFEDSTTLGEDEYRVYTVGGSVFIGLYRHGAPRPNFVRMPAVVAARVAAMTARAATVAGENEARRQEKGGAHAA